MIKGLTDRGMAFPQIGDIRKGDKGGKNGAPRELPYFRVELDAKEEQAQALFTTKYGPQPTDINIVLPFNEIDRCWQAWCEAYTAGRMVARSDGEYFTYLVDINTGSLIVQNGVDEQGNQVPHRDVIGKTAKSVIKCRPVGRLMVVVPELQRYAYLVVHTTSIIDIRNISEQLAALAAIHDGRIAGIPLVLRRRPREISVPNADGSKRRLVKHMISIEADPTWVAAKIAAMHLAALPAGAPALALPAVAESQATEEVVEEVEGQWTGEGSEEDTPIPGLTETTPEPTLQDYWPDPAKVSWETALTIKDNQGQLYVEKTQAALRDAIGAIEERLEKNNLTQAQKDELKLRKDTAETILAAHDIASEDLF